MVTGPHAVSSNGELLLAHRELAEGTSLQMGQFLLVWAFSCTGSSKYLGFMSHDLHYRELGFKILLFLSTES